MNLRVTKPCGLISFTVNEGVWHSGGFETAINTLEANGAWQILDLKLDRIYGQ